MLVDVFLLQILFLMPRWEKILSFKSNPSFESVKLFPLRTLYYGKSNTYFILVDVSLLQIFFLRFCGKEEIYFTLAGVSLLQIMFYAYITQVTHMRNVVISATPVMIKEILGNVEYIPLQHRT